MCEECKKTFSIPFSHANRRKGNGKFCSWKCRNVNPPTRKHGHAVAKTTTYKSWTSMNSRCKNKNAPDYFRYGGRGITVCKRCKFIELNRLLIVRLNMVLRDKDFLVRLGGY